jgi:GTPase SAR1 family protein
MSNRVSVTAVVLGDACVGKSDLVRALQGTMAVPAYQPTVGAEVTSFVFQLEGTQFSVDLTLWECPGNERFVSLQRKQLASADVCVLVCDVGEKDTFDHLSGWHDEFLQFGCANGPSPAAFIVAANKIDIESQRRVVSREELAGWCTSEIVDPTLWSKDAAGVFNLDPTPGMVEVSTHTRQGIPTLLEQIAKRGLLRQQLNLHTLRTNPYIDADQLSAVEGQGRDALRCVAFCESDRSRQWVEEQISAVGVTGATDVVRLDRAAANFLCFDAMEQRFALWTPVVSRTSAPYWFCRGAHVCLLILEVGVNANTYRLGLWKELFLRESGIRDPSSVSFVAVALLARSCQSQTQAALASYAKEHGMELVMRQQDDLNPNSSTDEVALWTSVKSVADQHYGALVINRTAQQSLSTVAFCPNFAVGCKWQGRAIDMKYHYDKACQYRRVKCRFEGCGADISLLDRESHERHCVHRPATCHFCERPYGVSLAEHLKLCEKREAFEKSHVPCPLADFGCPVKEVFRSEVARHISGDSARHIELVSQGLQRLKGDMLGLERRHQMELEAKDKRHREELAETNARLAQVRKDNQQLAEVVADMKLELRLLWEEVERSRKQNL